MFRAYDPEQDKLVAVKLFRLDLPPDRVHRLTAELQTLIDADLTHPAIAAPVAAGVTGVSAYLAQDFVVAEPVDVLVRTHGPAAPADAVRMAAQVAGALDFAAAVNITHGALHPRDVLVSSDDTRLTGLGLTRALERVGAAAAIRRPYTAPEQAAGAVWDQRADVFSLAAIVHELLWARRVTALGWQAAATLTGVEGADLDALRSVFACALAENPAERFETAMEFAAALKNAIAVAGPQISGPHVNGPQLSSSQISGPQVSSLHVGSPHVGSPQDSGSQDSSPQGSGPEDSGTKGSGSGPQDSNAQGSGPQDSPQVASPHANNWHASGQESTAGSQRSALPKTGVRLPRIDEPRLPLGDPGRDHMDGPASGEEGDGDLDVAKVIAELSLGIGEQPLMEELALGTPPIASDRDRAGSESAASHHGAQGRTLLELDRAEREEEPAIPLASAIPPQPLDVAETVLDRRRSSVWPLTLALVLGVAVGFALGYGVAGRARQAPAAQAELPASPPASTGVQGGVAETEVQLKPPGAGSTGSTRAPSAPAQPALAPPLRPSSPSADPAQPAPVPAAAGRLLIRSTPDGGGAFVDGRDIGRTPVTMRDIERGTHTVRVVREGYVAEERRVTITAVRPSQSLTFELTRARPAPPAPLERERGPLVVESRPAGARVFVDGTLIGKTPLTLGDVAAGDHAVSLDLDGYRRWSSSVRIVAGEPNRVTASLETP